MVGKVRELPTGHGLNVDTGEYVDLISAGIIDPAMVTRSALANAASIAKNIITTEALVVETPRKRRRCRRPHDVPEHGRHGRHGRDDVAPAHPHHHSHQYVQRGPFRGPRCHAGSTRSACDDCYIVANGRWPSQNAARPVMIDAT